MIATTETKARLVLQYGNTVADVGFMQDHLCRCRHCFAFRRHVNNVYTAVLTAVKADEPIQAAEPATPEQVAALPPLDEDLAAGLARLRDEPADPLPGAM